jgi:hypothetical protein
MPWQQAREAPSSIVAILDLPPAIAILVEATARSALRRFRRRSGKAALAPGPHGP